MGQIFFGSINKDASAVAVIMAGGSGTRFWPLSRKSLPKQYLSLGSGELSLIQLTAARLEPLVGAGGLMVVTAMSQKELVENHLPGAAVLAEPIPRNTCPCAGFAAIKVLHALGDVPLLCLPADHKIEGLDGITAVYRKALEIAGQQNELVTIGIPPTGPETGYGYIKAGRELQGAGPSAFRVDSFVEKPDLETAKEYLASGSYLWNSGMFAWRPSVLLEAIAKYQPELHGKLMQIREFFGRHDEHERIEEVFKTITPVSVDVGVMEKAPNVVMLSGVGFDWNDVGSWSSWVDSVSEGAEQAGLVRDGTNIAKGEALFVNSSNCATISSGRLVASVGLQNIIVIETPDAVLVCHKDSTQDVKDLVTKLQAQGKTELL